MTSFIILSVLGLLLLNVWMYFQQPNMTFYPARELNQTPIDYRGYGKSEGTPGEQGLYQDASAAWRYLTDQKGFANDQVIIFGRSLGGAISPRGKSLPGCA